MRKYYSKIQPLILLALCAALISGGCRAPAGTGDHGASAPSMESGVQAENEPADGEDTADTKENPPSYVYYIKGRDLMRADVNGSIEAGKNPSLVMKDIGENAGLKDYYDVILAEDGSYLVLKFETDTDIFSSNEKMIAVNSKDGTTELLSESHAYTFMCGNKLLFQIQNAPEDIFDTKYDLYSYTADQGKKLEIAGIYNFYPSDDGSVICFTRLDEEQHQNLYRYENGQETLLSEDMNFAYANEDYSAVYGNRMVEDGDMVYYELIKLGKDGSKETVLSKDDQAVSCFPDLESGGVYYFTCGEDGTNSLYYSLNGEKKLLSEEMPMAWESLQGHDYLDGKTMLVYTAGPAGKENAYAAVNGIVSSFAVPDLPENWLSEYYKQITVSGTSIYLTATNISDSYEPVESWLYRYKLSDGRLGEPQCVAHGTELYMIEETNGKAFYTDRISHKQSLYCDGTRILDGVYAETLRQIGGEDGEYFIFQEKAGAVPDLMRITTAGASKVFRENVVLCEPYAGGMLLFSDCRDSYPYLGTLSFYNGPEVKVIDEDVTVFFQHDENQFIDVVPWDWDWGGLMSNESTFIRYFIPDEENDRMIELSRQFLAGLENETDMAAYEALVESLKWDDGAI